MKKYRIRKTWVEPKIVEVEYIRETDKFLVIKGWRAETESKTMKDSAYDKHFDSWQEAHDSLLYRAKQHAINAKENLAKAINTYEAVKAMTQPEENPA